MTRLWRDASKNENGSPSKWTYEHGVVLRGLESVWLNTGDGRYFNHIQKEADRFVNADGTMTTLALTAIVGLFTLSSYLFIYTPLKQRTRHSTTIGAIPGAMPPSPATPTTATAKRR